MKQESQRNFITRWFRKSLLRQLLIPFIVLLIFVGGLISFVSYKSSADLTTEELSNNVESQMETLSDTFDIYFSDIESILERFANHELLLDPLGNRKELLKAFQETVDVTPAITNLYTGLDTGEIVLYPEADLGEDFVVKETAWFQAATEAGDEIVWTEPFIDASTGEIVVAAAKAHYDGDKLVGVVAVDIQVQELIDITNKIEIGETGYAIIIDETGRLIAHPDEAMIGENISEEAYYEKMVANDDGTGLIEYKKDGENLLIGYAHNNTSDWIVGGIVNKADFAKKARGVITPIVVTFIIVSIFVILFSLWITKKITGGLQRVVTRMKEIADGDISKEALTVDSEDEIGQLILATNEMNDQMRNLLAQVQYVSDTVAEESQGLSDASHEVTANTEEISATMQELAANASTQADHTTDLSEIMETFLTKVQEANEKGTGVYDSSKQVLDQTVEGFELMEASTEQMQRINNIVRSSVEDVKQLEEESAKISELVAVIEDIAEQTNLLALNASIEAARAGEHGRGFAIVAEEVGTLAQGVANSVTDITKIVTDIQKASSNVTKSLEAGYEEVEAGAVQITDTGKTFHEISRAIEVMVEHINDVRHNLEEISEETSEMNHAIQEVAAITEEASAGVEETSAATQQTSGAMQQVAATSNQLTEIAHRLKALVNEFKLY